MKLPLCGSQISRLSVTAEWRPQASTAAAEQHGGNILASAQRRGARRHQDLTPDTGRPPHRRPHARLQLRKHRHPLSLGRDGQGVEQVGVMIRPRDVDSLMTCNGVTSLLQVPHVSPTSTDFECLINRSLLREICGSGCHLSMRCLVGPPLTDYQVRFLFNNKRMFMLMECSLLAKQLHDTIKATLTLQVTRDRPHSKLPLMWYLSNQHFISDCSLVLLCSVCQVYPAGNPYHVL